MAVSINDVSSGKRRIDDVGDPRNFRHTKQYGKFYGTKIASGFMALVIIVPLITNLLDFFFPKKTYGGKEKGRS